MHIFTETANRKNISILRDIPKSIEYICEAPAVAHFADGQSCSLGCLGCVHPRCMHFDPQDIACGEVHAFPNDQTINACPVDAIAWNSEIDTPVIDAEKCINCGICINRCPVGAIYFDGSIKVNTETSPKEIKGGIDNSSIAKQSQQISSLDDIPRSGTSIIESDELFDSIYAKLSDVKSHHHNLIARNLLISLGCRSAMRRIGDVYTRMDAIYSSADGCFGAVEVEFGRDTLDASRGILDDIAVLYTRYDIPKDQNMPLVVCLQLPNARQGYWQVVKDIKTVEDITISTVTIGTLMILNWNGCILLPDDVTYYLDFDNMSQRSIIEWQINRSLQISDKHLGIVEPMK